MRNTLVTPFWRAAYQSLPEASRERYLPDIERAERLELAVEVVIDSFSRGKAVVARIFNPSPKAQSH